jgi:hypothetical protein
MKRILVDWVPNHRRFGVYKFAIALMVGLVSVQVFYCWNSYQALKTARLRFAESEKVATVKKSDGIPWPDEKVLVENRRTRAMLAADINPIFDDIESMQIEGVHLNQIEYDLASTRISLRYNIDSIQKISAISTRLNRNYSTEKWQFQQISSTAVSRNPGISIEPRETQRYIGVWHAKIAN